MAIFSASVSRADQKRTMAFHPPAGEKKESMAINKNHEFEELDGIKCAVVEKKNINKERADFLERLLTLNGYKLVVVTTPPAKAAVVAEPASVVEVAPVFTVGVSDVMFNAVNAVFGRLLRTAENQVVTLAYWQQKKSGTDDSIPYFE